MPRYQHKGDFKSAPKWRCPNCGGMVKTVECVSCLIKSEARSKERVHTAERDVRKCWDRTHRGSTPKRWLSRREPDEGKGNLRGLDF